MTKHRKRVFDKGGIMDRWTYLDRTIELVEGNLALLDVEAVVNAANKSLTLGGGVAGAIRSHGGPSIQEECNRLGPIEVGQAVMTGGGSLKAKFVIHAVGPIYGEGDEEAKLARATLNSLRMAGKEKLDSIALPAISTGIYRFPLPRCSEIMIGTALDFIKSSEYPKRIIFCLYDGTAHAVFGATLERLAG